MIDHYVANPTAAMLRVVLSGMSNLLCTEGDRRRVGIELERRVDPVLERDADIAGLAAYASERRERLTNDKGP